MITKITVSTQMETPIPPLTISMFDPSEYVIRNIEGLTPPQTSHVDASVAPYDGVDITGSRAEPRQLIFTIGFVDHGNVETLRRGLYESFPYKIPLRFEFDDTIHGKLWVDGYVETHESNIFSEEPLSQITVLCPSPMFRTHETFKETINLSSSGGVAANISPNIEYLGGVPTPISAEIILNNDYVTVTSINLEILTADNLVTQKFQTIALPAARRPSGGSEIYFKSCITERAFWYRDAQGVEHNLLPFVSSKNKDWPYLYPGTSRIRLTMGKSGIYTTSAGTIEIYYNERFSGL